MRKVLASSALLAAVAVAAVGATNPQPVMSDDDTAAPTARPAEPDRSTATDRERPTYRGWNDRRYAAGRVLVGLAPDAAPQDLGAAVREEGASVVRRLPSTSAREVRLPRGLSVHEGVDRLEQDPAVEYAEPDFEVDGSATVRPNDPEFPRLYGLENTGQTGGVPDADIDASAAWGVTVGSPKPVVAVIDTGVDISHPDLRDNVWTNPGELPGNRVDDDQNGYVDDVHGWDFRNDDNSVYDGPADDHGTHVAGTIAGVGGNGVGVTGVSWDSQVMPVKFLGADGGLVSDAVAALDYAVDNGARISNNSWGGGGYSRTLHDAIARAAAREHLFVAAAGNGGGDGLGDNVDVTAEYPAGYDSPSVVSVAATDSSDRLADFSNYGVGGVDLAAPGVAILSTLPAGSYGRYSGTSMATPHVSGAAALLLARDPALGAAAVKDRLLSTVDPVGGLAGLVGSGGRLNVGSALGTVASRQAVSVVAEPPAVTYGASTGLTGTVLEGTEPVPEQVVVLEQRPVGTTAWTVQADARRTTGVDGLVLYDGLAPLRSTDYRLRTTAPGGEPVTSPAKRVTVRALLSLSARTADLALGERRVVSGTLEPTHDGTVTVVVRRNGDLLLRKHLTLADGAFRWAYRPERPGGYAVFATWPPDVDHRGARSVTKRFEVR